MGSQGGLVAPALVAAQLRQPHVSRGKRQRVDELGNQVHSKRAQELSYSRPKHEPQNVRRNNPDGSTLQGQRAR